MTKRRKDIQTDDIACLWIGIIPDLVGCVEA